jgi:hypothetical protein
VKTYPIKDETGRLFALEVDMVSSSLSNLVQLIATAEGVTDAKARRLFANEGDVRARFRFHGVEFVVVEPFGNSSRYWIGPVSESTKLDISLIERQLGLHVPTLLRRVLGALLS